MKADKTCKDCIHYRACKMWMVDHTLVDKCVNYEELRQSYAYCVGFNDGTTLVADCIKAKEALR